MKLKYVDGFRIRNTLDTDFGVVGSNALYYYIPKNEIWLDKLYKQEKEHFLKIHLFELKLLKRMSYEKARKIVEKKFIAKGEVPEFVVRRKKYGGFIVKYVDGRIIRKHIDPKFILGCHWVLSKNIGKNEIWIDTRQDKRECKYTLIHEHTEALLMKKGMSYNDAHDYSIAAERVARRKDGYARYPKD